MAMGKQMPLPRSKTLAPRGQIFAPRSGEGGTILLAPVKLYSRRLNPSMRPSPQISSPGAVRASSQEPEAASPANHPSDERHYSRPQIRRSFQEPLWDPGVLKIVTVNGEVVAGRRKLVGSLSPSSFRPERFLAPPYQRDEIHVSFSPRILHSSFLGVGAHKLLGMGTLKTKLRKVYSRVTNEYHQKGIDIS